MADEFTATSAAAWEPTRVTGEIFLKGGGHQETEGSGGAWELRKQTPREPGSPDADGHAVGL